MTGEEWVKMMTTEYPPRLLLTAEQADDEIARLQGIIKAQAGAIMELQQAFAKLARGNKNV